jgi:hypothetical protein
MLHEQRAEYGEQIVATLSQQLTWSHVVALLPLKDSLQRDFYAEMCRLENWSVRTLRAKIDGMLFERTGFSRKPGELIVVEESTGERFHPRFRSDIETRAHSGVLLFGIWCDYRRRG